MRVINVIGYEGLYAVSDDGRVFSLKRGIELKQEIGKSGYYQVTLNKDNSPYTAQVHKIVFYSFNAYRQLTRTDNLVIDHIDGDKTNNHLSNLRKITNRENIARAKDSPYGRGVCYYKHLDKYGANIGIENERYHLGTYNTPQEAANAYQSALENYQVRGILPGKKDRSFKKCKMCGKTKPIDEFYYIRGHGHQTYCKECQRAYGKMYRAKIKSQKES